MHLVSGDYILIGPDHFEDINVSRTRDNELWFLSKDRGSKPVKFKEKMSEGMAISKKTMKVAYSQIHAQAPDVPEGASRLVVAEVSLAGGTPTLVNRKIVYESKDESCRLEAQDFYDNDTKMTLTCYEPKGMASVMGLDLATGKITNFSKMPGTYNEVEGIFPDGQYTCVEMDRQVETLGGAHGSNNIDIWKLKLDGTGKDIVRLTHFNDFEAGKASNPGGVHRRPVHGIPDREDHRPGGRGLWNSGVPPEVGPCDLSSSASRCCWHWQLRRLRFRQRSPNSTSKRRRSWRRRWRVFQSFDRSRLLGVMQLLRITDPGPAIRVVLASETSDWAHQVPSSTAGFAVAEDNLVVLFPSRSPTYPQDSLEDVLHHEVAHVLIARAADGRPVPRWFNEGLAMALERTWGLQDEARLLQELHVRGADEPGRCGQAVRRGRRRPHPRLHAGRRVRPRPDARARFVRARRHPGAHAGRHLVRRRVRAGDWASRVRRRKPRSGSATDSGTDGARSSRRRRRCGWG
jgi:hypothetical protein